MRQSGIQEIELPARSIFSSSQEFSRLESKEERSKCLADVPFSRNEESWYSSCADGAKTQETRGSIRLWSKGDGFRSHFHKGHSNVDHPQPLPPITPLSPRREMAFWVSCFIMEGFGGEAKINQ